MSYAHPLIDRTTKHCSKQGHRSKGAAEAHLRGLQKAQAFKPDLKQGLQMVVYYCIAIGCREKPWHVGHTRDARGKV